MSYQSKLESVRQVIEDHNVNVEEKVSYDSFISCLQKLGGSSEDSLKSCSWEDIEYCGIPRILARRVAKIFREENNESSNINLISRKKIELMSYKELLSYYDIKNPKSSVSKRLKEISNNKPCIVFNDDGIVNVEVSEDLLRNIVSGFPHKIETTIVNGKPVKVYKIDENPFTYINENPLYPGRALMYRDVCDQTQRSWDRISKKIRVFLYLAVKETKEIKITTIDKTHDILDKIVSLDSEEKIESYLRGRYQKTSLLYDEKEKINQLPPLVIKAGVEEANDPFYSNKTY